MKTKTYIIIAIIVTISNIASYYIGSHDIFMAADVYPDGTCSISYPHSYSIRESLSVERELANALFEGLHRFYANDDNEKWFEGFAKTKEYAKIDSIKNGDWEDFYYYETPKLEDWHSTYGTDFEPSEEYKDSVDNVRSI
jgi:hypothetical protein